ncbi:hypothetical protein FBU30_000978 [Linnemannia zychae]|nr:hypothetical protein FBU30_000978 [Linnemannia zychae]
MSAEPYSSLPATIPATDTTTTTPEAATLDDRSQGQVSDITMTLDMSPRLEGQDTISSQQPPIPSTTLQSQNNDAMEDNDVEKILKHEEQDEGVQQNLITTAQEESTGGDMEGVELQAGQAEGGVNDEHSEHHTTTTTSGITKKRTKAAASKSKKSGADVKDTRDNEENSHGSVEDEEDDEKQTPMATTIKSERGENNEEDELSLSSDDDDGEDDNEDEEGGAGSGQQANDDEFSNLPEETLCRWKDCGKVLPSLAALVIHLSDEHIGWKKTAYTCEWQGCARRPIAQTTRFALISHMRSHTKHKPYDCPVPECDKSFSRSDAMAKHLKFQHGDVPERFTGRKSRGRYTMKDPAASSTLLHSSTFGAKKRRHPDSSRSENDLSSRHRPTKLRKLGAGDEMDDEYYNGDGNRSSEHRYYHHRSHSDRMILQHLENARRGKGGKGRDGASKNQSKKERGSAANSDDDDDSAEDSDFEVDNGQTPRQRYGLLKAKYEYIHNEREALEAEYEDQKKRLMRLRMERELLLDALLASRQEFQDPTFQAIEDSE